MNCGNRLIDIEEREIKIAQQSWINNTTCCILQIFRIISILIFSIFMSIVILISSVAGADSNNMMVLQSTTESSLKLLYNSINASKFPYIVSYVSVIDNAGFIVDKLDTNNFEVREDYIRELPIDVVEVSNTDIGINVVLTIDRSASMSGQPIEDTKAAANIFVQLMQDRDQSAVVSFSHFSNTDSPFSSNKNLLIESISNINTNGGTAIFDAIIHSVSLMNSKLKNRAVILLTDGADKDSRYTYQEALDACLSFKVRVFTIGLGINRNSLEEIILQDLANESGGAYYYSPTSSALNEIYRAISMILHHQYQISYTTHNPTRDGTLRRVRIDVNLHGLTSSDTASYRAPLEEKVEETSFKVLPNPFTPNEDGFNDRTEFQQGTNESLLNWVITIMDRSGRIIKQLTNGERHWDGKDESGRVMLPGGYLYIVSDSDRIIHRGLVQIIR